MQQSDQELAAAHLLRHDAYFFFTCRPSSKAPNEFEAKDQGPEAFAAFSEAVKSCGNDLWKNEDWHVSKDFLPKAKKLFEKTQTSVRTLSEQGLKLANSGSLQDAESGATLILKLRQEACKRADVEAVPIHIMSLHLLHFPSNITVGMLRVQYGLDEKWTLAQASRVVLECNHYLSHPLTHNNSSRLGWASTTSDNPAPRFMGLVRALLISAGCEPDSAAFQRLFAFAALSTDAPRIDTTDFDLLLARLARKHTLDYPPGDGYAKVFGLLQNVRFSTMSEGAAMIVRPTAEGEFSANYLNNSVPRAYVPAILVSVHEAAVLRHMEETITNMPRDESKVRLKVLEHLRHDLLQFRLEFRMQTISGISMHNEFHRHLRTALGLDGSLDQLADDVQLVEQQLAVDLRENQERRNRVFTASASALASLISIHEVGDMFVRWKWNDAVSSALARTFTDDTTLAAYEELLGQQHIDETWWAVASIIVAVAIFAATWSRKWQWPAAE